MERVHSNRQHCRGWSSESFALGQHIHTSLLKTLLDIFWSESVFTPSCSISTSKGSTRTSTPVTPCNDSRLTDSMGCSPRLDIGAKKRMPVPRVRNREGT